MKSYGYDEAGQTGSLTDGQLWGRILQMTAAYKWHLLAAIILSLLITATSLSLPHLIQRGIDDFMTATKLPMDTRFSGIGQIAVLYAACITLFFAANFLQIVLLEWIGQKVMHHIRQTLFRRMLGFDLRFFSDHPTGSLVTRLTNDIQNMHDMFTSVIVNLFNDCLRLIGILAILILMNARLGLFMTLFLPLALISTIIFSRLARKKFRAMRVGIGKINTFLSEAISGASTIQLFGRERTFFSQFKEINQTYLGHCLGQVKVFGAFMPFTEFMATIATAFILWYGGGQVIQKHLSLGELVAFLSYMRLFFQPLRELSQKYSIVQAAMASAERIFHLLDTESQIKAPERLSGPSSPVQGEIIFNDIHFSYNPKVPTLRGINLHIQAGQTIAIVGTTGAGKTSLINLLLRFYDPEKGQITIDGNNISQYPFKTLRSMVGVILQDIILLQDTLLANIIMDTNRSRAEVEKILTETGMNRFVKKLPKGLDSAIGPGGQNLSTGEKQLLSFARVLCRRPAIIVLDEATAAIDTESENILEEALAKTFVNRTSIIIAHRLSTIKRADKTIVMDRGRIIEQGSHQELLALKGRYYHLVRLDQKQLGGNKL
ncbi:ABC transporter ATP-binding protein [Desulfotalea psychrophila]|uniref:Multidrug resistance-like ATP-binding protein MdlB n=1 Tax=Desulfotalea psychrophila (strain LSv54 / DSM 12343) TaxID=177439 RepID=Q6AS65_DESPS|nr:ABC transporter ATP-binding protein [Desulfotalea psychrophila]CAG34810.1 related to ABC transporter, ATP-binding protein [Desulfotalea psychrophila LSv54]